MSEASGAETTKVTTQSEGLDEQPYGSPSEVPGTGDATPLPADLETASEGATGGKNPDELAAGPAEEADPGTDLPVNTGSVE